MKSPLHTVTPEARCLSPRGANQPPMEFALLGWPDDGPTLRLDHRRFSYAGKFVTSNTGKAVTREGGEVVAAIAFSADRTDPAVAWLRYVTVRDDHRGGGVGPRLCAYAVARLADRGYARVRIAVNNPFAFEALHKVGFAWTGEETGIAELVLERPAREPATDREATYRAGLDEFRGRENLSEVEREFLAEREGTGPPDVIDPEFGGSADG